MRAVIARLVVIAALFACMGTTSYAWDCTTPGQIRVQVPTGTIGNGHGDGGGQVDIVEGITFECMAPPTSAPSTSTQSQTQNQTQSQTSSNQNTNTAKATGGSATSNSSATGGSVNNSGNSTNQIRNTNVNVAQGGQGGSVSNSGNSKQTQTANATATGNGDNSNNYTENVPRQVSSAYAPTILPTTPCFKGYSAGGQGAAFGVSFGGGKIDENCARLEVARSFAGAGNRLAYCKTMLTNKYVQQAGITLADCMNVPVPAVQEPTTVHESGSTPIVVNVTSPVVNVPAPVVTVVEAPNPAPAPAKLPTVHHYHKPTSPCITNDDVDRQGPPKNKAAN
jgi:hypothetical protein